MATGDSNLCSKDAALRCGGCYLVYYYSGRCQKLDHKLHKQLCKKMAIFFQEDPRPADTDRVFYKLAILFPGKLVAEDSICQPVSVKVTLVRGKYKSENWPSLNSHVPQTHCHETVHVVDRDLEVYMSENALGNFGTNAGIARLIDGYKSPGNPTSHVL